MSYCDPRVQFYISNDGQTVYRLSYNTLKLYDVATKAKNRTLTYPESKLTYDLAVSGDDSVAVACAYDGSAVLHYVSHGSFFSIHYGL